MFHNLPRLNSGFLNTSWQTSRNIPTPKTLSKDFTTPTSYPKPQSEVTLSPPLSPRSPVISSQPSSPHSQSSNTSQKKSSASYRSTSELPSPILSPEYLNNHDTSISPNSTPEQSLYKEATTEKALIEESPLAPKEPCSPNRPSSDVSNQLLSEEEEQPASQSTGNNKL